MPAWGPSRPSGLTAVLAAVAVLVAFAVPLLCRHGVELRPPETLKERVRSGLLLTEVPVSPLSEDSHQAGNPRAERRSVRHRRPALWREDPRPGQGMRLGHDSAQQPEEATLGRLPVGGAISVYSEEQTWGLWGKMEMVLREDKSGESLLQAF